MTLGEYIKSYRASHGIGQREFAQMCGISAGYVSMLENNKNPKSGKPLSPRIEIYQQVAAATGIGLDEIIAIVDDNITISPKSEKPTVGEDDGLSDEKREAINAIYEALKNLSLEDLQAIGQVVAAISSRVSPAQPRD